MITSISGKSVWAILKSNIGLNWQMFVWNMVFTKVQALTVYHDDNKFILSKKLITLIIK